MPAENHRRTLALLIWAAYFIIPSDAGGLVHGLPLGPIEAAALLAIGWVALFGGRVPMAPIAAAVMILTTAAGLAVPGSNGFRARYFASIDATGSPERSGLLDPPYTRIDDRLDFTPGGHELPLNFFNDNSRFSFFQVRPRERSRLEFSVRWSGSWRVPEGVREIYVDAPGATGEVFVDGRKMTGESPLTPGWHRLDVALTSPYAAPRRFSAGTIRDGLIVPFDSSEVVTQQIRDWQMTFAHGLSVARTAGDLAALILVIGAFGVSVWRKVQSLGAPAGDRERRDQVIALFAAVAAIDAARFAWPWATRVMMLVGGDDTLTYESYARDILFNGILMTGGKALGHGEAFYYQAFYPYFLAATHAIFGEFMFGAILVQRLLAAYAIVKLVEISIRFTAERAWVLALPIAAAFVGWKFWHIADEPLNESLYVPMLVVSTAAMIRLCDRPRVTSAIWTGIVSGIAAITRSTSLVAFIGAWPAVWFALRGSTSRNRVLACLIASFVAVFSLVAVRNAIVAGVFAPTSTEMGITLLGGNELPPGFAINPSRLRVYQRAGFSDITASVIDYAISEPRLFAMNLGRKALFVLGFYEPYAPGWGYSPVYMATWIAAIVGLWLTIRNRTASIWPLLVPAIITITQFIAIVIVYPKGERLVVPVHIVLIPYCVAAAWFAVKSLSSDAANVSRMASRAST